MHIHEGISLVCTCKKNMSKDQSTFFLQTVGMRGYVLKCTSCSKLYMLQAGKDGMIDLIQESRL